ncbi:hypothetical protein NDU88_005095 [Pleurodeles waltl]|uniref:Uncharacterized protein n=1 Tax=Pleurodeles waltl TaxID=8319 RepID=A0AAV7W753_PLEWA|nr:hypothetical protein NDU88_005095 [Pleurodeles waltl]
MAFATARLMNQSHASPSVSRHNTLVSCVPQQHSRCESRFPGLRHQFCYVGDSAIGDAQWFVLIVNTGPFSRYCSPHNAPPNAPSHFPWRNRKPLLTCVKHSPLGAWLGEASCRQQFLLVAATLNLLVYSAFWSGSSQSFGEGYRHFGVVSWAPFSPDALLHLSCVSDCDE